ncbi:MAG: RIP metalloprotease RseP [Spirochaetaceae bacterium]|nr:RIP metalloprotease RseP [Spirochaetaceae bacterium]
MLTILYGILGLGLIVLIHETGHLIAARMCGVKVEAFSVGMGPILLHKTIKDTDYRLSLIPLGGYCEMKGEKAFSEALESNAKEITGEPDSLYGVHPLKRAFIAFMGPFFNVIFAFFAFIIISAIGYNYYSTPSKIILANEVYPDFSSPAAEAGLKTGDTIYQIDEESIINFADISSYVSLHPDEELVFKVLRDNKDLSFVVKTELDTETGAGKIGVLNWVNPLVAEVIPDSSAANMGLSAGATITKVDGEPVFNTTDISLLITGKNSVVMEWEKDSNIFSGTLDLNTEDVGIRFASDRYHTPTYGFFGSIKQGFLETIETIGLTFKSIGLLFKGVDFTSAVSGPIRITQMIGETAVSGFSASFSTGIVTVLNFLALISISLFIMNLLPIPILDGGLILFALIETISRRKSHPKVLYYVQFIGLAFIAVLFCIALFSDFRYLFNR